MEDNKITLSILPNEYLERNWKEIENAENLDDILDSNQELDLEKCLEYSRKDNKFDLDRALNTCGKIGGICYNKEGWEALKDEPKEKTDKRIDMTINNGHHSVYDHIYVSFYMRNIPKMLAMVLNNEKQYTTSEKSARYTQVASQSGSSISKEEEEAYNKWTEMFKIKIKNKYGDVFPDTKIKKLAMENARYMVSVFMPTSFVYTTSLRQINLLAAFMQRYIKEADMLDSFDYRLATAMKDTLKELERLNVLDPRLMTNNKERKFSLFGEDLDKEPEYFGKIYTTNYKASYAELAQAQRHRSLNYQMERSKDNKEFFVPPIIDDCDMIKEEWLKDIKSLSNIYPQGELVLVNENGEYEKFIEKIKERLCSAAQLEINNQTRETLLKYRDELVKNNNKLQFDIEKYTKGARCTFPDFTCTEDCHFAEGKRLIRKI
jgi:thymidylate synthase ThyX